MHRGSLDVFRCLPLALLLLQATCASDAAEAIGAVGSSVTFYIQSMDGNAAAWSFHNDVIAAVEFGDPPKVTFFDDTYKPRWTFSKEGRGLTISQLRMDDAGTYTAKVMRVKTTFTLYVYRELAVPTVTCTAQNCSADGCRYTLHCTTSGSGSGNVSYGWSKGGQPWSEGPTLLVEESPPDEPPLPLTCTARNPVGSRNATVVSPAALCAENTTHPPAAGTYSSSLAGIVAGSVVGAIVLLAVFFMIYWKSKGWRIFCLPAAEAMNAEAGAEYATVYAEVGPSSQVHLQSVSNAQQDKPNKTLTPGAETAKTIYFTVQAAAQTDDEKMRNDEKHPYLSVS